VLGALLACGRPSDAGATADAADTAIGPFNQAARAAIPTTARSVRTSGFDTAEVGGATYVYDAAVDQDYVVHHPRSAFILSDGRGFRLQVAGAINPEMLGLRTGLDPVSSARARANQEAIAEALSLTRRVLLPAGTIDFRTERGFGLPALDGMEIAGHGWGTRIVTRDSAFLLPTLNRLTIRDLWIEQVATGRAAISSYHTNLRDIRLLRLKITMRDQATYQNNCILLVADGSSVGPDGVLGVKDLLIEDCWLAPGRMGIEIQNHRVGDDKQRLYGYRNVTIRGCTVWKAPAGLGMGISLTGWGTDCLIERNRFVACHGPNVEIVGSDRTTVTDNIFEDAIGVPVTASNFRIMRQCRILRNRTVGRPPHVVLYLQAVDGAEVANNTLSTTGTTIIKGSNVHIHDNSFTGVGTGGLVQLDNARRVTIEKNHFTSKGTASPQAMVLAFNDTRDCIIRSNRMECADYDIRQNHLWFFQAPPARGSIAYGNDRRGRGGRWVEPTRQRTGA
jgi:hypothetical protein